MRRPQARRHHGVTGAVRERGHARVQGAPSSASAMAGAAARQDKVPGEQLNLSGVANGGHTMAKPTDLTDSFVQTALVEAEQALDTGDYLRTVRKCVEVYSHIAEQRP